MSKRKQKTALKPYFNHEKLDACRWAGALLEDLPARRSVRAPLDRASTNAPLNLTEGNGKFFM